jgi:hydroxyethylthiazole kinase-like uncharacterized protein yjeF
MRPVCAVATVRSAEASAGVLEPVLMQRASWALAGVCVDLLGLQRGSVRGARVVALVGSGNNGGDALWALAALARRGAVAVAVGDPERMHAEGLAAARAAGAPVLPWSDPRTVGALRTADLALDGIVGIGGTGGLREPAAGAVETLAAAGVPIVAVDVPSGVDSDTGEVPGPAVTAAVTVCFGVLKAGLVLAPGRSHAGAVAVIDIGLRPDDLDPLAHVLSLADLPTATLPADTHKYRRGVVGVAAGSDAFPGAALLAVGGARRSGAGMVALAAGGDQVGELVVGRFPDVVLDSGRPVDARCVGPGLGDRAREPVLAALAEPGPVVVDASGLDVLATRDGRAALAGRAGRTTVLTPHAGEFARLGFDPSGGPLAAALRASRATGAVLVLKGPGTVVAAPDGTALIDTFGTADLATAGSGDVLAGLIAGRLATAARTGDLTPRRVAQAVAGAVALHGLAGRLAAAESRPVTAVDVLEALPSAGAAAAAPTPAGRRPPDTSA